MSSSMDKGELARHTSKVFVVAANVCFMIAFCTPAWIKNKSGYVIVEYVQRAGLWELCSCGEVFTVFKNQRDDDGDVDPVSMPMWYTAAQVFAVFALLGLIAAIVLSYLFLTFDKFHHRTVAVLVLLSILIAVGSSVIAFGVFGAEFFKEEALDPGSSLHLRVDWGFGIGCASLFITFSAMLLSLAQIAMTRRDLPVPSVALQQQ